jgi:hypothetical protein
MTADCTPTYVFASTWASSHSKRKISPVHHFAPLLALEPSFRPENVCIVTKNAFVHLDDVWIHTDSEAWWDEMSTKGNAFGRGVSLYLNRETGKISRSFFDDGTKVGEGCQYLLVFRGPAELSGSEGFVNFSYGLGHRLRVLHHVVEDGA